VERRHTRKVSREHISNWRGFVHDVPIFLPIILWGDQYRGLDCGQCHALSFDSRRFECGKILDNMDSEFSMGSGSVASARTVDSRVASASTFGDHFFMGVPNADHFSDWHLETCKPDRGAWDRQILERLLSTAGLAKPELSAEELIQKYGSLFLVLQAAKQQKIKGTFGKLLLLIFDTHKAILDHNLTARPILANSKAVIEYLTAAMAHLVFEQVRILFLGTTNKLVADRVVSIGTIDEAPIYPREIVKIALEVGAAGLIIAHNHPSGDPNPSRADIENTKRLMAACRGVQLVVHDHIVIAAEGWMSMRASGLI
jgi:DNA repair protein RadC